MNIRPGIAAALLSAAAAITQAQAPAPVAGVVFEDANRNGQRDAGERGLSGVAVSNQREVVRTAADGSYSLPRPAYGIVFVSLPDGYATVGNFWRSVSPSSNSPVDFALTARAASGTFTFIHASDTHVSAQTLGRLQQLRAIAEKHRPDFVLVTGDLVRDALRVGEEEARGYYDLYTQEVPRFSMPVWSVPGQPRDLWDRAASLAGQPQTSALRQRDVPAAPRPELLLLHPRRRAFRGTGLSGHRRSLVLRACGRRPARVAEGGPVARAR